MVETSVSNNKFVAERLAVVVGEVAAPAVLVSALLVVVAAHYSVDLRHGVLWGGIAVLCGTVAPMVIVYYGMRRKAWDDHHVSDREKRLRPALSLASIVVGYALLLATDAAEGIVVVYTAIVVETVVLMFVYGPIFMFGVVVAVVVAWARVKVRAHTLAQALAAAVVVAVSVNAVYAVMGG